MTRRKSTKPANINSLQKEKETQTAQKFKIGQLWLIILAIGMNIYALNNLKNLDTEIIKSYNLMLENAARIESIFAKISADEDVKFKFLKLQKNLNVWQGTSCINCHNTAELALPITKISIIEAINIVRHGNTRTIAQGMPIYHARPTKGGENISDNELQTKLQSLYTKEFLDRAEPKRKAEEIELLKLSKGLN